MGLELGLGLPLGSYVSPTSPRLGGAAVHDQIVGAACALAGTKLDVDPAAARPAQAAHVREASREDAVLVRVRAGVRVGVGVRVRVGVGVRVIARRKG